MNYYETNRLAYEKSPYLLEHAMQPIFWFPWGEDAFEKAKKEDKPIFLSIGYSSCHWCHVMAKESFEDEEVAKILNENYIAIKVDREERPDIDAIYMQVCNAITGSGGWPLTIIMTPDQKPFFAGTYIPKDNQGRRSGLINILTVLSERWKKNRETLLDVGNRIESFFQYIEEERTLNEFPLTEDSLTELTNLYVKVFDTKYGGFQGEPKFPPFTTLRYLMRAKGDRQDIEAIIDLTLHAMASGGLYDQIEGGFFRYATDEQWLIPHFEKMLYDNAQAIITYCEAAQSTTSRYNKAVYERIAKETLAFLLKRFYQTGLGFSASSNADAEEGEGAYYLWDINEIKEHFPEYSENLIKTFHLEEDGLIDGKNLPHYPDTHLKKKGYSPEILEKLANYRHSRMPLQIDHKIITVWNSLMVVALTRMLSITKARDEKIYLGIAEEIIHFLEDKMINAFGRLGTSYIGGKISGDGYLDDYAYLSYAYYSLYEVTGQAEYLEKLVGNLDLTINHFFDHQNGGFYLTSDFAEKLFYRPKEVSDRSIPSSNAILLFLLQKVKDLVPNGYYQDIYALQLKYIKRVLEDNPTESAFALLTFLNEVDPGLKIVYRTNSNHYQKVLRLVNQKLIHNHTLLILSKRNLQILNRIADYGNTYPLVDQKPTFHVCTGSACLPPIHELDEIKQILER